MHIKWGTTFHCQGVASADAKQLVCLAPRHLMTRVINQHTATSPLPHPSASATPSYCVNTATYERDGRNPGVTSNWKN